MEQITVVIDDVLTTYTRDELVQLIFFLVEVQQRVLCFRPLEHLKEGIVVIVGWAWYINSLHALRFDIDANADTKFVGFYSYFATEHRDLNFLKQANLASKEPWVPHEGFEA